MIRIATYVFLLCCYSHTINCSEHQKQTPLSDAFVQMLNEARTAHENGDYDKALNILYTHNKKPHALIELYKGLAYNEQNKLPEARQAFEKSLQLNPKQREAGLALLNLHIHEEQWTAAIENCGQWIQPHTSLVNELILYAQVAIRCQNLILAEEISRVGMLRFPTNTTIRDILLSVLIQMKNYDRAFIHLQSDLMQNPEDAQKWQDLAAIQSERNISRSEQRVYYEAALLKQPSNLSLRESLARLQLDAGQTAAALSHARILVTDKPTDYTVFALHCAMNHHAYQEAHHYLDTIPEEERTPTIQQMAVQLALAEKDHDSALTTIAHILEAGHHDDALFIQAALLFEEKQEPHKAESFYRQCIQNGGPNADNAQLYLARLLFINKRYTDADKEIKNYIAKYPQSVTALHIQQAIASAR